jgi:hypothetical protein
MTRANIAKRTGYTKRKTVRMLTPKRLTNQAIQLLIDGARAKRARLGWLIRKYKSMLTVQ